MIAFDKCQKKTNGVIFASGLMSPGLSQDRKLCIVRGLYSHIGGFSPTTSYIAFLLFGSITKRGVLPSLWLLFQRLSDQIFQFWDICHKANTGHFLKIQEHPYPSLPEH